MGKMYCDTACVIVICMVKYNQIKREYSWPFPRIELIAEIYLGHPLFLE